MIDLFCYISFLFELCMYNKGTYKISSTKSAYYPKQTLRIMNFVMNILMLKLHPCWKIIIFSSFLILCCIFINNIFNKYYFSIFNKNFKLVSTTYSCNTRSAANGILHLHGTFSKRVLVEYNS